MIDTNIVPNQVANLSEASTWLVNMQLIFTSASCWCFLFPGELSRDGGQVWWFKPFIPALRSLEQEVVPHSGQSGLHSEF